MAVNVDLIRAYLDGLVASHEPGATPALPTTPTAALTGFTEVGAISSDGLSEALDQTRNDQFIWQNNALARSLPGQSKKTLHFAAAETNLFNLGLQYPGSTITQTAYGASVSEKPPQSDVRAWVVHGTDGDSRAQRVVIPKGEITERGEVVWSSESLTVYDWTLTYYPDTSGFWAYRYFLDDDMATP